MDAGTTKLSIECYPYNWVEYSLPNGTQQIRSPHSIYAHLLSSTLEKLNSSIEFVSPTSQPQKNVTTLAEIQSLIDGVTDMSFEMFFYRHDRAKLIDYIYPFKVKHNQARHT